MHPAIRRLRLSTEFIEQMRSAFAEMDRAYRDAAAASGFVCSGCSDNCCRTLFYHHTYAECLYLIDGFGRLPAAEQQQARQRAGMYLTELRTALGRGRSLSSMCPLNADGKCILYAHRPMICRLHGIPHEFDVPGRPRRTGRGCDDFYRRCGPWSHAFLDRTPHYRRLADIEMRLKQALGLDRKFKATVAEMLMREPLTGAGEDVIP